MRLILSGGGTGGHIIPNIALIHELRERFPQENGQGRSLQLLYLGTPKSMEEKLMEDIDVPFAGIITGKLLRYFSLQNAVDFFKVPVGILQSLFRILEFKPDLIFCKGGYVCFPVAFAGWLLGVPVILHESDVIPGLANRLSARFVNTICVAYEESKKYFPKHKKIILTGNPVRRELALGSREEGLKFLDLKPAAPIVFFMGGSLGADFINQTVWRNLDHLLPHYQIVHIYGHGNGKNPTELLGLLNAEHQKFLAYYRGFPFIKGELKDIYATADAIVSRAGAMSLAEIDFFEKPVLLIPLSRRSSRGDQIINAQVFAKDHLCVVMEEKDFSDKKFLEAVRNLVKSASVRNKFISPHRDNKFWALEKIVNIMEKVKPNRNI